MGYTEMYEIQDSIGVIHSGTEDEMTIAFEFMTESLSNLKIHYPSMTMRDIRNKCHEVGWKWIGDLKLVKIINIHK